MTAALALFLFTSAWQAKAAPYEPLKGKEAQVRGQVLDYPQRAYHKFYYRLRIVQLTLEGQESKETDFTVRLSANQPFPCQPGDVLDCTAAFYGFSEKGLYSRKNTWLANGVTLGAYLCEDGPVQISHENVLSLPIWCAKTRHRLFRSFSKLLPGEEAGLIQAMLLGDRSGLSQQTVNNFRSIGSSHLLAISGLHISALTAFFLLVFRRLPLGRMGNNLLCAASLLAFLAVIGFPVSAVRSGIMYLLFLLADCFGRRADSLNSLGFALFALCLSDPFSGGDVSLALSASATLGILVIEPFLQRLLLRPFADKPKLYRAIRPVAASFSVTLSVTLCTLPIQAGVFGGLSLLSPLSNLILVFPCTLLLYCSLGAAVFLLIPGLAAGALPFGFVAGHLARGVLWAAKSLSSLPGQFFSLDRPVWLIALGGVFLVFLTASFPARRSFRPAFFCAVVILTSAAGVDAWQWRGAATVAVAEEENDSCVVLIQDGEASILSLGGYRTQAASEILLRHNVRRVNTLFLPQNEQETRQAALDVLSRYKCRRILFPQGSCTGQELSQEKTGIHTEFLSPGGSFEALPGIWASLSPDGSFLTFEVNGFSIGIELGQASQGNCQLLITPQKNSRVNSSFTVLQTNDIIAAETNVPQTEKPGLERLGSAWDGVRPGSYFLLPQQGSLCADIFRNGTVRIREGN